MKKKNGFTLIELLAIIVILAIIAVITVPIILNIIENSKMGAVKDSAYGYKDSVNKWYVSKLTENPNYVLNDGTYSVSELGATVEGKQPGSNSWVTISKTNVTDGCLQFDEYKVEIINGEVKDTVKGECTGSTNSSLTKYGYKSYENNKETEIMIGTSGYTVTGKPAYLKYALTNGAVAEGTVPETCIYSDTYDGELCLKNNESETSKQKILDYFGYDASAWTNTSGSTWKNSTQTISCFISASNVHCHDSAVGALVVISDGSVSAEDDSAHFGCHVYVDDYAECY